MAERGAFRADQFRHRGNYRVHLLGTGPEILAQSGGTVEAFCDFVGTGGSFAGCAAAFKAHDPSIRCYVVEPAGAAVLAGQPVTRPGHRIQGGGYAMPELPLSTATSTATCRSLTKRQSPPPGACARKAFLAASPPVPTWPPRSSCSRAVPGEDHRDTRLRFGPEVFQHGFVGRPVGIAP